VWADDGQVVLVRARKAFARGHLDRLGAAGVPRAEIHVAELSGATTFAEIAQLSLVAGA